jgi:hypothetical protein
VSPHPINDDEIIDRVLKVERLTGSKDYCDEIV